MSLRYSESGIRRHSTDFVDECFKQHYRAAHHVYVPVCSEIRHTTPHRRPCESSIASTKST